jgi:uncharacterized membrane protein HdeD (DUF308 family)
LIGLQFVVLMLIADRPVPGAHEASAAFASPTIVHFAMVLFLSALLRAPWQTVTVVSVVWGLLGLGGGVYSILVARRMRQQNIYKPEFEDWLCHTVLPLIAYAILALSSLAAADYGHAALFCVGGAALLLLFIGIHNAWDGVSYHVLVASATIKSAEERDETSSSATKTS